MSNKRKFKCKSEAQKRAIRANYARMAEEKKARQNAPFEMHFRRYKKKEGKPGEEVRHPKLIIAEDDTTYNFMGLTESPKRGHHKNIVLLVNPKKGDKRKRQVYLRDENRKDSKDKFYPYPENGYKLSKVDKQMLVEYLEKKKKK